MRRGVTEKDSQHVGLVGKFAGAGTVTDRLIVHGGKWAEVIDEFGEDCGSGRCRQFEWQRGRGDWDSSKEFGGCGSGD